MDARVGGALLSPFPFHGVHNSSSCVNLPCRLPVGNSTIVRQRFAVCLSKLPAPLVAWSGIREGVID